MSARFPLGVEHGVESCATPATRSSVAGGVPGTTAPPWHPPKMRTRNAMLISLLAPALLLAAEEPPPTSMLPLSDHLLLKHFGETTPPADSGYGRERRRRRMTDLTAENTDRIRIHVDYASLYEETAPLYSACFQVGAWYSRGLAGPTPPADGVATCRGETSGARRTR